MFGSTKLQVRDVIEVDERQDRGTGLRTVLSSSGQVGHDLKTTSSG